ncbi:hypothetical protein B0T18DRAFT_172393 [Schizothecium vesticola]|uniref:Cellobiose dehydrogenase-like cytochrome domain-containing protein n=1 Tax=Schizothecium vesticola TaxID=314040 RepID=A0AA40EP47_9PEZI|nr:hypothetical protein B0T18DRAFT_172393 [Schizothecium vesticola]
MRPPLILAAAAATLTTATTTPYTDPLTNITFQSFTPPSSSSDTPDTTFRIGLAFPPSPDQDLLLLQITTPLSPASSSGWGALSLGPTMRGPLLLVAWPDSTSSTVRIAPRVATSYAVDGTVPYTATAVTLTPIPKGTYFNATHLVATFVCAGCVNTGRDAFDTAGGSATGGLFSYAYSMVAVRDPGDEGTLLSSHVGGGGILGCLGWMWRGRGMGGLRNGWRFRGRRRTGWWCCRRRRRRGRGPGRRGRLGLGRGRRQGMGRRMARGVGITRGWRRGRWRRWCWWGRCI